VQRVESLRPNAHVALHWNGKQYAAQRWREFVQPGPGVTVEARFDDGHPALLRQGRTRYLAARVNADLERSLLETAVRDTGLAPTRLPEGLRLRRRGRLLFAFNYSGAAQELNVPQARWLIGSAQLPPQGLAIAQHDERAP
jgi:beta-galactosidase